MKKIYLSIATVVALISTGTAQLTLTKAANEPVIGDVTGMIGYDSTAVLPKNTGAGQTWNFVACTQNTTGSASSFTNPASVSSATAFPGCSVVEVQSTGLNNYWKSVSTPSNQWQLLGVQMSTNTTLSFTTPAVIANWPISYGYNYTSLFSGNVSGSVTGPLTGTVNTQAVGTGTLMAPGGATFNNVLQLATNQFIKVLVPAGPFTATVTIASKIYSYYSAGTKNNIVNLQYTKTTQALPIGSPTITSTTQLQMNPLVITGINNASLDAGFQLFPNPATESVNLTLSNPSGNSGSVSFYNITGQKVKTVVLGNENEINTRISTADLTKGIYFVKVVVGNTTTTQKLILN
ncbi:MAG: T9SS type A sorting domain-containing protein [Bacteroidetes bacterium]|nr:T9SS type A sorting domain-containing protein [Bacteroidota bacterium]